MNRNKKRTLRLARRSAAAWDFETRAAFRRRVVELAGVEFSRIPRGQAEDLIGSHILAQRGAVVVIFVGDENRRAAWQEGEPLLPHDLRVVCAEGIRVYRGW